MSENVGQRLEQATEVAFSFDTTGSMQPCIKQVRHHLEETCEKMFADIPGLRIGLIAHGDYCDGPNCICSLALTDDRANIFDFIRNAPNTSGGDSPECYELALHVARDLGWSPGKKTGRALVLIGDDVPHEPDFHANTNHLDWRVEVAALKEMGIRVYPLQCLGRAYQFWSEVAHLADTKLMLLNEFCESGSTLEGVAYAAAGTAAFATYAARTVCRSAEMGENLCMLADEAEVFDSLRE